MTASGGGGDFFFDADELFLTDGYTSGAPIALTFSAENKTLADFGWSVGDSQVIATLPNDQINFVVVPEPATFALAGVAGLGLLSRRKR